ncbi:MAG: hypothetical protein OEY38_23880 [Gammaproteobacteria bacterium]|nr:hypothetical protein [Gammaproteobacteria bacterium]
MEKVLTEKQRYWLDHLKQIDAGDLSSAAYAREHQLDPHALYRWGSFLTKQGLLAAKTSVVSFAQVSVVKNKQPSIDSKFTIEFPNGCKLLCENLNTTELQWLINAMQ